MARMECGNEAIDHAQVRFAGADRLAHCCRRLPALRPTAVGAHSSTFVRLRSDADSNVIKGALWAPFLWSVMLPESLRDALDIEAGDTVNAVQSGDRSSRPAT
ncbi:MAG: hypothetical protein U1F72_02320 [Gammaproteobacteria bacterium]